MSENGKSGDIESRIKAYYSQAFSKHGDTPRGVDWKDRQSQTLRFEKLLQNLPLSESSSILDVGCGTGALLDYLLDSKHCFGEYTGIDIVSDMIDSATQKHKGQFKSHFQLGQLAEFNEREFDFIVCSGIFNVKQDIAKENWQKFVQESMMQMYSQSRIACAFNFLTAFADFNDEKLYYCQPSELMDFFTYNLSRKFVIDHGYPLFEFTATVFKSDPMKICLKK